MNLTDLFNSKTKRSLDINESGIPGNVPVEKIPGKQDLLKGRGRSYYEDQKTSGDGGGGESKNHGTAKDSLKEFAPVGGDDREPNEEEILRQLAAQWWNGTEQQMAKAQNTLASMGWEIGQDESGDDDAGVFVIRVGDENGNSYMAFNHSDLDLNEGVAEGGYGHLNPDLMSAGDYDRYQQDQMDFDRRDFKRREHEAEWEQEKAYSEKLAARDAGTWYIRINGKILKDKQGQPYTFSGKAAANRAAVTMMAKPFNTGKEFLLTTSAADKI